MKEKQYELVTVYRGKDSFTYLLKDFQEHGDEATPLWVKQWPGKNEPLAKLKLKDADGMYMHNRMTKDDIKAYEGKWDLGALEKLLPPED